VGFCSIVVEELAAVIFSEAEFSQVEAGRKYVNIGKLLQNFVYNQHMFLNPITSASTCTVLAP
jgi:hypothetical protein